MGCAGDDQEPGPADSAVRGVIDACWALSEGMIDALLMTRWPAPHPDTLAEVMQVAQNAGLRADLEEAAWRAKQGVLTSAFRVAFPRPEDIPAELAQELRSSSDSFDALVEVIDRVLPGIAAAARPVEYAVTAFALTGRITREQTGELTRPLVNVLMKSMGASDEDVERAEGGEAQLCALTSLISPEED